MTIRSVEPGQGPGKVQTQAQHPPGLLQGSWETARSMDHSPAKQGLSSTRRDLVA